MGVRNGLKAMWQVRASEVTRGTCGECVQCFFFFLFSPVLNGRDSVSFSGGYGRAAADRESIPAMCLVKWKGKREQRIQLLCLSHTCKTVLERYIEHR